MPVSHPRRRAAVLRVAVVATAVVVALGVLEFGARLVLSDRRDERIAGYEGTPLHVRCDCPYLYRLNPDHPEISSQGLRDRELEIPKPPGTRRILVLGDSVAFGHNVAASETFPKRLESILRAQDPRVEVINAGVTGWSTYNEREWYRERGRAFEADVVLLAFCMNDVVNPRLHWNHTRNRLGVIPEEAIPNPEDDRTRVQPLLAEVWPAARLARAHPSPLHRSRLYSMIVDGLAERSDNDRRWRELERGFHRVDAGRSWQTNLTLEDTIGIDVLLDRDSPEWRWLARQLDALASDVRADGARLVVAILPLAYQLEPGYPYRPQEAFLGWCAERDVACVDLVPTLSFYPRDEVFMGRRSGFDDVWHLTERGHRVVASTLQRDARMALDASSSATRSR